MKNKYIPVKGVKAKRDKGKHEAVKVVSFSALPQAVLTSFVYNGGEKHGRG